MDIKTRAYDNFEECLKQAVKTRDISDYMSKAVDGVPNDSLALVCFLVEHYSQLTHENTEKDVNMTSMLAKKEIILHDKQNQVIKSKYVVLKPYLKTYEICAICQDDLVDEDRCSKLRGCEHRQFHTECMTQWLKFSTRCPLCREFASDAGPS